MAKLVFKWGLDLCLIILVVYLCRVFFLDVYRIPSDSMNNSILPNEYILVSKVNFEMDRNGIYIFKSPVNSNINLVKRCVGLPGDTIEMRNNELYVNNKLFLEEQTVHKVYKSFLKYSDLKKVISISLSGNKVLKMSDTSEYILNENELLRIKSIYGDSSIFLSNSFRKQLANYGPIVIPYKGMTYHHKGEWNQHYVKATELEDIKIGRGNLSYTFNKDYYFFLGDNRPFSEDSRAYGFVPKQNIVGKAQLIVVSNGTDRFLEQL